MLHSKQCAQDIIGGRVAPLNSLSELEVTPHFVHEYDFVCTIVHF